MFLKYGSYQHQDGEVDISVNKNAVMTARGTVEKVVEQWKITGILRDTSSTGLSTKASALQTAYGTNNLDLCLYHSVGVASHLHLNPSEATGGIRVLSVNFPKGAEKGEFANARHYEITVEAIYPNLVDGLLQFQETITYNGTGGPRYAYIEILNGPPVRQTVCEQTLYRITQSGHAIGLFSYPTIPSPLWPYYEDQTARQTSRSGGQLQGTFYSGYGVQWSYQFVSDVPLYNNPTVR